MAGLRRRGERGRETGWWGDEEVVVVETRGGVGVGEREGGGGGGSWGRGKIEGEGRLREKGKSGRKSGWRWESCGGRRWGGGSAFGGGVDEKSQG